MRKKWTIRVLHEPSHTHGEPHAMTLSLERNAKLRRALGRLFYPASNYPGQVQQSAALRVNRLIRSTPRQPFRR